MVPQEDPPAAQLTCHVIEPVVFVSFAVNVTAWPGPSVVLAGTTAMEALLFTTVTVADALLDVLALETAVTITVGELGTLAGAVYRPDVEIEPQAETPVAQEICQVTAVFEAPVTVAVNCTVWLMATDAAVGAMLTAASDGTLGLQEQKPNVASAIRTEHHFAIGAHLLEGILVPLLHEACG
jgi:hypothetical protein